MSRGDPAVAGRRSARQALRCPDCRLVITTSVLTLSPRHCPRCLARRRVAVGLEALSSQATLHFNGMRPGPAMSKDVA